MRPLREMVRDESAVLLAKEVLWRTRKQWNKARFRQQMDRADCPVTFRPVGYYQPDMTAITPAAREIIVKAAGMILGGRFPCLGFGPAKLGFPPHWNKDLVSGKSWPMSSSGTLRCIRHDGSDIKVPWELSRLQFLPVLGKAYRLTGDGSYRAAARTLSTDWITNNPLGKGPNWTVAMEAALRALSLCFMLELLWPMTADEESWLNLVTRSLWQHCFFIESHLEFSHLFRGNHYLSNVLGLLGLALYLEGGALEKRRTRYWQRLQAEVLTQVYEDGGDYEASLGYQVFTSQIALTGAILASRAGLPVREEYRQRLSRMFALLAAVASKDGRVPQVGDCDDGRVELLHTDLDQWVVASPEERDSLWVPGLLALGQSFLHECISCLPVDQAWHGISGSFAPAKAASRYQAQTFPNSGVAVGCAGDIELAYLAIPNGIRGKGSHTHNDKLSIVCRVGDSDLLIDSGTGCYTRDAATRNRFRSTAAHNTVVVDGLEQNTVFQRRDALFCLGDEAVVDPIRQTLGPAFVRFSSAHRGYSRMGVIHEREVLVQAKGIVIEDRLLGSGKHEVTAHFHLGRDWQVQAIQAGGDQGRCILRGPRSVMMSFSGFAPLRVAARSAWVSRCYGVVVDGHEIVVTACMTLPASLTTRIILS